MNANNRPKEPIKELSGDGRSNNGITMNQRERIDNFERLGLGLFVHYGIYSVPGNGEWYKEMSKEADEIYNRHMEHFSPRSNWAEIIAAFAKKNGFRYVVLTTRHHDGFSLYDTKGLSEFDAAHLQEPRDLVREFVDACRAHGLIPFFYHTLIDWREEEKYPSFHNYLEYLRKSIELLCTQYGKIGGFWLDGQWKYPDADWELDALYGIIRKHQPNAIIVNNSGLDNLGAKLDSGTDVVTFERADMLNFDRTKASGIYGAEMCQTLNGHWGYAKNDIAYKSISEILESLCVCRSKRGNFLLNIGPEPDGCIRPIDRAIIDLLGQWINVNSEALYEPRPYMSNYDDGIFALQRDNLIYVFFLKVPTKIDPSANEFRAGRATFRFPMSCLVKSAKWIDNNEPIEVRRDENGYFIQPTTFSYGTNLIVRVAACEMWA